MNWQDIKVSADNTHFLFDGKQIFGKKFIEVLKFHSPGFAPVKDESGSYHIDITGNQLYAERFTRSFGFYCSRAAVVNVDKCFHITDKGEKAYKNSFAWTGNFQENLCTVRGHSNNYFHINLYGKRVYNDDFIYCGDFKDGIACVKLSNGLYKHIDINGLSLYNKQFLDLGVFHKNFAIAKDKYGWFHIDKSGNEIYSNRFLAVEPFYNGYSLATNFDNNKNIINEYGKDIIEIN